MHKRSFFPLPAMLAAAVTAVCLFLSGCLGNLLSSDPAIQVRVLKIGKADASILYMEDSSQAILIDTGEDDDGGEIVENLTALGITKISHMIITHYDKDHMGGAAYILEHCSVDQILQPDYPGSGKHYEPYQEAAAAHGNVISVSEPMEISVGEITLSLYPENDPQNQYFDEDDDNNRSLVTMASCREQKFLFTGDIQEERIALLLQSGIDLSCDWIKMPHHGSYNNALQDLLEAARPRYAVICCSDKNPADPETLELLNALDISCWLTADGDISFTGNGESINGQQ